jgi:iron complex outermembrane recepter protein
VTTIEQAIGRLSAAQISQGTSQSVGSGTGGAAFADLRGIGADKTLVLLNGRRVANNAFDSSAVDINMIPFAALARVEVLRDGASALYGTDAIGGVINFITKKDFQGGNISAGVDLPQESGGRSFNVNGAYGIGNLDNDGFNFFAVIDYQKQNRLEASQREFGKTGFLPNKGVDRTSGTTFPASYTQVQPIPTDPVTGATTRAFTTNPLAGSCAPPFSIDTAGLGRNCRYDFTRWIDLVPETDRLSVMLRGAAKLGPEHTLNLEYFRASNTNATVISPVPQTGNTMNSTVAGGAQNPFFPGNGITPAPTAFTIDPTLPISVNWRAADAGPRQSETDNVQHRFVAGLEGVVKGWDYAGAFSYNQNRVDDKLTGGYSNDSLISAGIANGIINPFGAQTAAGAQYIKDAALRGDLQTGRGTVYGIDATASRDLGDWVGAGRNVALALGGELRREDFDNVVNIPIAAQAASTGVDESGTVTGGRTVAAIFGEINIPITKDLEFTGAVRFDDYSDFGNTTNPKVSVRYQPIPAMVIRGSYSTGFRAPSLYELYAPKTLTFTENSYNDPVLCPDGEGGVNTPNTQEGRDCNQQFLVQRGGNQKLNPEESKNFTLGLVLEPLANLTVGVDFWRIELENQITELPETLIFGDPAKYAARFNRDANGTLSPDGSNPGFVVAPNENLGDLTTYGIDLKGDYRLRTAGIGAFSFGFNGTYVIKYKYQREIGGEFVENQGRYIDNGPIFRWQHSLNVGWTYGDWGAGIVNRFKAGYTDQNDGIEPGDPLYNNVDAYSVFDLYGTWAPTKAINLTVGVRNVLDEDPPFSNQGSTFQVGYDPRFTDPIGRAFYIRGSYSF